MALGAKHCFIICLIEVVCLIGSAHGQSQSREDARKRSFAELLTRRAKAARAESRGEIAATSQASSRTTGTTRLTRSTGALPHISPSASPLFAAISPLAVSATGVSSATPVTPSGSGPGRDAFVEAIFPLILGRDATQGELDYWSGRLAKNVSPATVATLIFNSQEHRSLVRRHQAPGIPLGTAYRRALASSRNQN